jgi:hypothetical protein
VEIPKGCRDVTQDALRDHIEDSIVPWSRKCADTFYETHVQGNEKVKLNSQLNTLEHMGRSETSRIAKMAGNQLKRDTLKDETRALWELVRDISATNPRPGARRVLESAEKIWGVEVDELPRGEKKARTAYLNDRCLILMSAWIRSFVLRLRYRMNPA